MSFSPSSRHNSELEEIAINLNPMMDMFAVLIPALLMLSAVVEVAVVEVSAPSIGPSNVEQKPPDTPPLNLTVTVLDGGYMLTATGGELPGIPRVDPGMTMAQIPLKEMGVVCSRFRGTVPPPRSRNLERPGCNDANARDTVPFLIYDIDTLNQAVLKIHQTYPNDRNVIIAAESSVQYESIIDVLDATRVARNADGSFETMFTQAVLSPATNM
ncbi:MAG: biopolymer transporter ExbD [Clostridia bacterium]|nr:biopolymer transporter ExbD [Deltaproteobacteria bacterium]